MNDDVKLFLSIAGTSCAIAFAAVLLFAAGVHPVPAIVLPPGFAASVFVLAADRRTRKRLFDAVFCERPSTSPVIGTGRSAPSVPGDSGPAGADCRDPDRLLDKLVPAIEDCFARIERGESVLEPSDEIRACVSSVLETGGTGTLGGETRQVTVLLSDLRGFTVITETYAAREVVDLLNRYFDRMCRIIYKYGGTIDKFMGDSIMALFGAPSSRPDDVMRAVCCAVDMQIAMDDFNRENENLGMPCLYMGIGINTGQVVAGKIGSELHSEYTVIGDEVNLASRIEAYTLRGQILMSANTYRRVKNFVRVKDPIHVAVKGKRDSVPLYELLAVGEPYDLVVPEREVRRSLRADVNIPFRFHLCEGKKICSDVYEGRILNISSGGMFACSSVAVEAFFNLVFRLDLPLVNTMTGDIYGKILRVKQNGDSYEMNIEFTVIAPRDREAIKELVGRTLQG